jgi:hypothetical protein
MDGPLTNRSQAPETKFIYFIKDDEVSRADTHFGSNNIAMNAQNTPMTVRALVSKELHREKNAEEEKVRAKHQSEEDFWQETVDAPKIHSPSRATHSLPLEHLHFLLDSEELFDLSFENKPTSKEMRNL